MMESPFFLLILHQFWRARSICLRSLCPACFVRLPKTRSCKPAFGRGEASVVCKYRDNQRRRGNRPKLLTVYIYIYIVTIKEKAYQKGRNNNGRLWGPLKQPRARTRSTFSYLRMGYTIDVCATVHVHLQFFCFFKSNEKILYYMTLHNKRLGRSV